ncbi:MAG: citramalate synthase [Syntrophomonadaceae bacterium]|nr:citramalate synthase [Syntrophomonadaceae bacterium]
MKPIKVDEVKQPRIFIYDTTLRDGAQGEGISFSALDKIKIAVKLDSLGIHYIEGGWPGSNPKDIEFFHKIKTVGLKQAKISAFTSTCKPGRAAEEDNNLQTVIETGAQVACIVGKSWDFHVEQALQTSLEENLRMIRDSVAYFKKQGLEVIFDAEHFFDGFKANSTYTLRCLEAAVQAGTDWICLCDTNGGSMPWDIEKVVAQVVNEFACPVAIHTHNDGELAVVNALAAIRAGATQVQGTINGYGERCGNANLCSVIPNLQFKLGYHCLEIEEIRNLTEISHFVAEIANMPPYGQQPFVGHAAFAHKGGIHVSAILKNSGTYEHMDPALVGNRRRVLVSELAGVSNLLFKAEEFGIQVEEITEESRQTIEYIKELEHEGYQFEGAEASLELLLRRAFGKYEDFFELEKLRIIVGTNNGAAFGAEAVIKIKVNDVVVHTAAEGNGPVNALDNALRKALGEIYPSIQGIRLTDYKVRVLDEKDGTGAKVRVLIETSDVEDTWSTVGVSENIIEASFQALMDSVNFALLKKGTQ